MGHRSRVATLAAVAAFTLMQAGCSPDEAGPATAPPAESEGPTSASVACRDGAEPLDETLSNGAAWAMCWRVHPDLGMVVEDIHFIPPGQAPTRVIDSISISQLEVPYDSGKRITSDITAAGFGGVNMETLTEEECLGERLAIAIPDIGDGTFGEIRTREVLCSETRDAGLAYRSGDGGELLAERHTQWELTTISKVGWYEYLVQYTFGADGSIRPRLGATGDISPVDFSGHEHGWSVGAEDSARATSHAHNAVWRVHWALGDGGGLAVEQYDARPVGRIGVESPLVTGRLTRLRRPTQAQHVDRRWWRVLNPSTPNSDGHPISYQIDLERTDSFTFTADMASHGPRAGYDIAFTNAVHCQVYATENEFECGRSVLDFVAIDKAPLTDVVSWVAVGFHHVVRDEDQSPMDVHWQGFTLTPRDLTAQRVAVPQERADLNGRPDNEWTDYWERKQEHFRSGR